MTVNSMGDASYYHAILRKKIPYAARSDDFYAGRNEWNLVAYYTNPSEVLLLDDQRSCSLDELLAHYNQTDFFDFSVISQFLNVPDYNDDTHCTCTHSIQHVYVIHNRITNHLCRVGSECVLQFENEQMTNTVKALKDTNTCQSCTRIFKKSERNRIIPDGQGYKLKDLVPADDICYCCGIHESKRTLHRCSRCLALIPKSQERCITCVL